VRFDLFYVSCFWVISCLANNWQILNGTLPGSPSEQEHLMIDDSHLYRMITRFHWLLNWREPHDNGIWIGITHDVHRVTPLDQPTQPHTDFDSIKDSFSRSSFYLISYNKLTSASIMIIDGYCFTTYTFQRRILEALYILVYMVRTPSLYSTNLTQSAAYHPLNIS